MAHTIQGESKITAPEESIDSPVESNNAHRLEPLIVLAKRKSFILSFVAGAAVLSAVVSLFLPKWYTSTAKILPPQQNQSMAAALLGQLGPLAGLAGGKDLGIRNPNELYISMLRSRVVADNLVDRFSLMERYHTKLRGDARGALASASEISAARDGIISVSVVDKDPRRAADMANAYIEELDKLTRTLAVTDAAKQRLFFEREVTTASEELAKAEDALKRTEETTGIIQLDSQSKVMLQAYADLRALASAKEVQIQAMRAFATPENPELVRAEQELAALRAQVARFHQGQGGRPGADIALEKVPGAGLEYVRRLREVKYRETLLELLTKQYEIARIDEAKGASVIQVLESAIPPERRSWPPRTALVLASTLLALIVAVAAAFLMEKFQRAKEDPRLAAQFQLLWFYLSGRHRS